MINQIAQTFELKNGSFLIVDIQGGLWELSPIHKNQAAPEVAAQAPPPSPGPKRKPGRPRKVQPTPSRVIVQSEPIDPPASAPTFQACRYCHRELPTEVLPDHEENCRIAAQGPYTHIATPGKPA